MTTYDDFTPADDGLHSPTGDFYETETFWFSFFVPERELGGWLYTSVRATAGTCAGGAWIWDGHGTDPWEIPFFEQFSWLKYPAPAGGPERLAFATGTTIDVRQPLMSYDLRYSDRDRVEIELRFDALEGPVPLRSGAPPFPKAHHFDQTGHVTGRITLDGETIDVDCYAMRDRSWGRRTERGYQRIGYVWGASAHTSFVTYSTPREHTDDIHAGYLRIGDEVAHITRGRREVRRDPSTRWIDSMIIDAIDDRGRDLRAEGQAVSRMILPGSTSICINTLLRWTVDGNVFWGEDQDVWPIKDYRALTR